MFEVEAKIKAGSTGPIRTRLIEKGAVFDKKSKQTDSYFNSPVRDFAKSDEALRIRSEDGFSEITYKGPKVQGTGAKAREEFNVEISDPEDMAGILERIGFFRSAEVFKTREEFRFMETSVALDSVDNLGEFVEIEVITDDRESALKKIEKVRKELEIFGDHIPESYLEMIINRINK